MVRTISVQDRRWAMVRRHHLAGGAASPEAVDTRRGSCPYVPLGTRHSPLAYGSGSDAIVGPRTLILLPVQVNGSMRRLRMPPLS